MKNVLITAILFSLLSISGYAQTDISLTINHKLGNQDFALDLHAINNMGHDFKVTRLQYYISDIILTHDGGAKTFIEDTWILVDASAPTSVLFENQPVTELEGMSYKIGVDSASNHLDPATFATGHPLAPIFPSMHWGWASGYRFIAFEGFGGANLDQRIEIHGLGDDNYFETILRTTQTANNNEIAIAIDADYSRLVEDMILINGVFLHGFNRQGLQILENARDYTFQISSGMSGLNELSEIESFDVYPNPTTNSNVSVQFEAETPGDYSINVIDILGRRVSQPMVITQNNSIEIPLPGKGIYFIEVTRDGKTLINKKVLSH